MSAWTCRCREDVTKQEDTVSNFTSRSPRLIEELNIKQSVNQMTTIMIKEKVQGPGTVHKPSTWVTVASPQGATYKMPMNQP